MNFIIQCAAHVINELLTTNLQYIMEKETLMMVYSNTESVVGFKNDWEDSDWRRSVCFKRLAFLINSPHYRYYALRGFVISAGSFKFVFSVYFIIVFIFSILSVSDPEIFIKR